MTYCVGVKVAAGLVFASDSRTNAGMDQVNICRKMHIFVREGELEFQHEVAGQMVSEKAGPGGAIYVAFGTRHTVKNVGAVPARYFVIAIGGDAK